MSEIHPIVTAATEAFHLGYVPIPIRSGAKRPHEAGWGNRRWSTGKEVEQAFIAWVADDVSNIGLLLGAPSGGLVDVDLDSSVALRLRSYWLPHSAMMSGRAGRRMSHHWYLIEGDLPATRKYTLPDGTTIVEIRASGAQTVIPPSIHPSSESYFWEGTPWGGETGPKPIRGAELSIQIAGLAMTAVLVDAWPTQGSRHEAYLALAGGLLRYGDNVHPWWVNNIATLIEVLADATHDRDGADNRVKEVVESTIRKLREPDRRVSGFTTLATLIGEEHVDRIKRAARDIDEALGLMWSPSNRGEDPTLHRTTESAEVDARQSTLEEVGTWEAIPFDRYMSGESTIAKPTMMPRVCETCERPWGHKPEDDCAAWTGAHLIYPNRVNAIFGAAESAKGWITLGALVLPEMARDGRVIYIDFENGPDEMAYRWQQLLAHPESKFGAEDLSWFWRYLYPEGPIAKLQRYERRGEAPTKEGTANQLALDKLLQEFKPTLIVVDGITSLFSLNGHSTNDAVATDVVGTWLKGLCRNPKQTVVIIDHTGKDGDSPTGSHHKKALVQGVQLRADIIDQPIVGELGKINLIVYKDRPSGVRAVSDKRKTNPSAGVVYLDSRTPDMVQITIRPPDPNIIGIPAAAGAAKAMRQSVAGKLRDEVLAAIPETWIKSSELAKLVRGDGVTRVDREAIRQAWKDLVDDDGTHVERRGDGPSTELRRRPQHP